MMNRFLLGAALCALLVPSLTRAEDPNFCYEGWTLQGSDSTPVPGSGCVYVESSYYCESTG